MKAGLQGRVSMDRVDDPFDPVVFGIDVMTAVDPGELPTFLLRELCQAFAADSI